MPAMRPIMHFVSSVALGKPPSVHTFDDEGTILGTGVPVDRRLLVSGAVVEGLRLRHGGKPNDDRTLDGISLQHPEVAVMRENGRRVALEGRISLATSGAFPCKDHVGSHFALPCRISRPREIGYVPPNNNGHALFLKPAASPLRARPRWRTVSIVSRKASETVGRKSLLP